MPEIDLNCDLGEGFADDAELMPLVSSVNIACGGHAGDDDSMRTAVALAKQHGLNIGAHPGYEDHANFGRVAVDWPIAKVVASIDRQIRRLVAIAAEAGVLLTHVKPHGALYHAAGRDVLLARELIAMIAAFDSRLAIICPPSGGLADTARAAGIAVIGEGFVDRRYQSDGTLVPRSQSHATIHDPNEAAAQAMGLITHGRVTPIDGPPIQLRAATLCVHGDGAQAVATLTALRARLDENGITVRPFRV